MRIAIGSLMQETNTFVPFRTTLRTFENYYLYRGNELLHGFGEARVEIPAFLAVLGAAGVEPVPLLAAHAGANGPVQRDAFDQLVDELIARLHAAGHVDAVLL